MDPTLTRQSSAIIKREGAQWLEPANLNRNLQRQHFRPGPWVEATKGEVWPKPKVQKSQQEFFSVRSNNFKFEVNFNEV